MDRRGWRIAIAGWMALMLCAACVAGEDVFILSNGGRVAGVLLNPDESPRKTYVIKTAAGQITLSADQVKRRYPRPEAEVEYEKIRSKYPDTVEGQWKLAEWCREHELREQRETHLRRVIELDPNHKMARNLLGYQNLDGQWQTHAELMAGRGLVLFEGSWLSSQEIQALQRRREAEKAVVEWRKKLRQCGVWLGGPRTAEAVKELEAVRDPAAAPTLIQMLVKDRRLDAQRLYIAALGRIGTGEALKAVAERAINDGNEEVRVLCLDELKKVKNPDITAHFVGYLNSKDNRLVNRAGTALREMGDPSAIWPLINSLVTVHRYKISSGNPGQTSASFDSMGGTGFSTGNSDKIVDEPVKNHSVLEALLALANKGDAGRVNYDFDAERWRYWFASRRQTAFNNARRD